MLSDEGYSPTWRQRRASLPTTQPSGFTGRTKYSTSESRRLVKGAERYAPHLCLDASASLLLLNPEGPLSRAW